LSFLHSRSRRHVSLVASQWLSLGLLALARRAHLGARQRSRLETLRTTKAALTRFAAMSICHPLRSVSQGALFVLAVALFACSSSTQQTAPNYCRARNARAEEIMTRAPYCRLDFVCFASAIGALGSESDCGKDDLKRSQTLRVAAKKALQESSFAEMTHHVALELANSRALAGRDGCAILLNQLLVALSVDPFDTEIRRAFQLEEMKCIPGVLEEYAVLGAPEGDEYSLALQGRAINGPGWRGRMLTLMSKSHPIPLLQMGTARHERAWKTPKGAGDY
jgi:hypothetical protein